MFLETLVFVFALIVLYLALPTPRGGTNFSRLTWPLVARIVAWRPIADWLIRRAMRTPYAHLPGYMMRYWLFNPYEKCNGQEVTPIRWLPSIRVHHILRRDFDRHKHDHPWDARTIILRGCYTEEKVDVYGHYAGYRDICKAEYMETTVTSVRCAGDTAAIKFGEFHSITYVPPEGVWTLFITFGYKGTWGFLVDGVKVPWREYLEMNPDGPWSDQEKQA